MSKTKPYALYTPMEYKQKNYWLKSKYGITFEELVQMSKRQGQKCAICNKHFTDESRSRGAHVDHDHVTGKVRGLLCGRCNTGLGLLGDNIRTLANAIVYLQDYGKTYD